MIEISSIWGRGFALICGGLRVAARRGEAVFARDDGVQVCRQRGPMPP